MRVCVFSNLPTKKIKKLFLRQSFIVTAYKPDIVVSYGGHGTFLSAERNYPEVPKLVVRLEKKVLDFEILEKELENAVIKIKKGYYKILSFNKVEASFKKKNLVGLNEVQIRNKDLREAIRFNVLIGRKKIENVIGDGIIVATPIGAYGYYRAAGGKLFKNGIGLCFNNCGNLKTKSYVIKGSEKIVFRLNRGEAQLAADNNPLILNVREGETVQIFRSQKKTNVIKII
ncbi:MAG: hypothetical protein QXW01_02815 [Candidatus Aenigmatarchaeota archaeon]